MWQEEYTNYKGIEARMPTLKVGQMGFTTDTKKIYIGSSTGNVEIAKKEDIEALLEDGGLSEDITNQLNQKIDKLEVDDKLKTRDSLYRATIPIGQKAEKYVHIIGGVDSQTAGASGNSYVSYFARRMRGEYGHGGSGYIGFQYNGVDGFGTTSSSGITYLTPENYGAGYGVYSFDNKGFYIDAPTGSEYFAHNLTLSTYDKVTLFYLKQPDGGSFNVYYQGDKTNSVQTVNTSNSTYDVGFLDLGYRKGNDGIRIDNFSGGKICVFAVLALREEGFIWSTIGNGGQKVQWHNNTDATFREKWLELLKPDAFIFIGGGNDSSDLTASQYESVVRSYIQPYINKNVHIIIGRAGARQNGENVIQGYEDVLIPYAKEKKLDFLNIRELFGGTYTSSVEGGYVSNDGIHPSARGCLKTANALLDMFGVPKLGATHDRDDPTPISHITTLQPKWKNVALNTTANLYRLGFRAPATYGLVEVEVTGFREGSIGYRRKTFRGFFQVGSITNQCTSGGDLVIQDLFNYKISGNEVDFALSGAIEGGLLIVKVTPTSSNMNFVSTCKVTYQYLNGGGRNVWDNKE